MRVIGIITGAFTALAIFTSSLLAGDWSDDQKAVWSTIEKQWEISATGDASWASTMLAEGFSGWGMQSPAPQSADSTAAWYAARSSAGGKTIHQELVPMKIIVRGDMAFVHYYYQQLSEDKNGKRETETGRWTDILVKEGSAWKFIGWQGGADPE